MALYGMIVLIWMEKVQVYQKVQIKDLQELTEWKNKWRILLKLFWVMVFELFFSIYTLEYPIP